MCPRCFYLYAAVVAESCDAPHTYTCYPLLSSFGPGRRLRWRWTFDSNMLAGVFDSFSSCITVGICIFVSSVSSPKSISFPPPFDNERSFSLFTLKVKKVGGSLQLLPSASVCIMLPSMGSWLCHSCAPLSCHCLHCWSSCLNQERAHTLPRVSISIFTYCASQN